MDSAATGEKAWPELHRVRRAIVVVDVVESVRLMQAHEADFIDRWRRFVNEVRTQVLPQHGGRLVKSLGDGMLLEFEKVSPALAAASDIHARIAPYNVGRPIDAALMLRLGVNCAEVVIDELDIYGAGVNLAARLASLAEPGQTVVSSGVHDELVMGLDPVCIDLGECFVKHLRESIRAYRLIGPAEPARPAFADPAAISMAPTVVVLPIDSSTSDPAQDVVRDLLADSLTTTLASRPELNVISRLSAKSLEGRPIPQLGFLRALGAHYALAGNCRVLDGRVVASFELLDTSHGRVMWSTSEHTAIADLLQPRCELIERVCQGLADALVRVDAYLAANRPLPTLESHALHLGAVSLMHRSSRHDFDRVGEILEHLIDRHSRVAAPRAWLAKWYVLRMTRGLIDDPQAEARRALDQTRRAVDAEPGCALALAMEGFVHCHLRRDLDRAAQRLDEATTVGPNEPLAWLFRGAVHAFRDEGESAVSCTERALALSPVDPLRYYFESLAAAAAVAAGRNARAIELAQRSLQANVMHTSTYRTLAIAQVFSGQGNEAAGTVRRLLALEPGFTVERFLARVPAGASAIGLRFARALAEAGVPGRVPG